MSRPNQYYEQENCNDGKILSYMPPLDLISASSTSCSDSVSSLETDDTSLTKEGFSPFTPPRSIFKLYWEKSGMSPQEILPPAFTLGEPALPLPKISTDKSCKPEEILSQQDKNSPSQARRSIFGAKTWSSERLNQEVLPPLPFMDQIPKTSSTSSLCSRHREAIPLTPCLKTSPRRERTKSSDSVKFSSQVDIRVFSPEEKHATEGWNKWFV